MKLTEAKQKRLAWFIAERQSDQGMPLTTLPEFVDLLLAERDEQAAEVKRLRDFIQERVATCRHVKTGGYHGRRVSMEAAKLLAEPEYFPGRRKVAEGTDADPEEET